MCVSRGTLTEAHTYYAADCSVFLCFEYCQTDLASILDSCGYRRKKDVTEELARQTDKGESSTRLHSDASRTCFSEPQVKLIMKQLLSAVDYMHENWTVHRCVDDPYVPFLSLHS